jgi:hypothetical protein
MAWHDRNSFIRYAARAIPTGNRFGRPCEAMDQKREIIMLWMAGIGAAVGASAFALAVIRLLLGHNSGNG